MQRGNNIAGFESDYFGNNMTWFVGYVDEIYEAEKRRGAEEYIRVDLRIIGANEESPEEVPLGTCIMPCTGASTHDQGETPGLEKGSFVVGFYLDRHRQHPVIIGSLPGLSPDTPEPEKKSVTQAVEIPQVGTGSSGGAIVDTPVVEIPIGGSA